MTLAQFGDAVTAFQMATPKGTSKPVVLAALLWVVKEEIDAMEDQGVSSPNEIVAIRALAELVTFRIVQHIRDPGECISGADTKTH